MEHHNSHMYEDILESVFNRLSRSLLSWGSVSCYSLDEFEHWSSILLVCTPPKPFSVPDFSWKSEARSVSNPIHSINRKSEVRTVSNQILLENLKKVLSQTKYRKKTYRNLAHSHHLLRLPYLFMSFGTVIYINRSCDRQGDGLLLQHNRFPQKYLLQQSCVTGNLADCCHNQQSNAYQFNQ